MRHFLEESARGVGFGTSIWYPDDVAVLDESTDRSAERNDANIPPASGHKTESADDDDDSWAACWEGGADGTCAQQPMQRHRVMQGFCEAQDVMEMEKWSGNEGDLEVGHGPYCSICLEPLSSKREAVLSFFCRHSFHFSCLHAGHVRTDIVVYDEEMRLLNKNRSESSLEAKCIACNSHY